MPGVDSSNSPRRRGRPKNPTQSGGVGEGLPAKSKKPKKKPPAPVEKVVGDTLIQDLNDPHRKRGTYALLQRAIDVAMDIPFEAMRMASMTAVRDLSSSDDRIRSRAREFLLKVQDSGVGSAVGLDRMVRLDDGTSTENVAIASITPEALAAVVQTIRGNYPR
jgi:hypothetical protein